MNEVSDSRSEITDGRMYSPLVTGDMRTMLVREVEVYQRELGRKQAVSRVARANGLPPRRVLAILHDEVRRFWFDEVERAKAVYRDFLAAEERRAVLRVGQLTAERLRLDELDQRDGVG